MTLVLLGTLVLIDGTLCGFRAAAGRNPRIFLFDYYGASMLRGARAAVGTIVLFGAVGLGCQWLFGDVSWNALVATAGQLVRIYGTFATLVLLALGLYLSGSFDFGVLASVLVLGPFTLVRPWVIMLGALWAAATATRAEAAMLAVMAGAVMAGFEQVLDLGHPPWRGLEGDRAALPPENGTS